MADVNEIPPFPNPGVRLIKEDEHVAIWEEVFEPGKPTPPHRHTRDYIFVFPNGGELVIAPLAGKEEETLLLAGEVQESSTESGAARLVMSAGSMVYGRVPPEGVSHYAVNEGQRPALMILIEMKGTGTEKKGR
jgi:hypothetical protein